MKRNKQLATEIHTGNEGKKLHYCRNILKNCPHTDTNSWHVTLHSNAATTQLMRPPRIVSIHTSEMAIHTCKVILDNTPP